MGVRWSKYQRSEVDSKKFNKQFLNIPITNIKILIPN